MATFKPNDTGKKRRENCQAILAAVRALALHNQIDATTRDLIAFISLALEEVEEAVDSAVKAWEKRDYWLKADRFMREWGWVRHVRAQADAILRDFDSPQVGARIPALMAELSARIGQAKIVLPVRKSFDSLWENAYEKWEKRPEK